MADLSTNLTFAALGVSTVALSLWVADQTWSTWLLRRRPVIAVAKPLDFKVRIGTPLSWVVTVENRSPRRLKIRLGAIRTQPMRPEDLPSSSALGDESVKRLSDYRSLQTGIFFEFEGYDLDKFRLEEQTERAGSGTITPVVELQGLRGRRGVLKLEPFDFAVEAG